MDPNLTLYQYSIYFISIFDGLTSVLHKALGHPDLRIQLEKGFDVVISYNTLGGPEIINNYLAERTNASLVYYATAQGPSSRLSQFIGQPYNPAYMIQTGVVTFENLSSFFDRVMNTFVTIFNEAMR